jgi:hypothetical protein
MLIAVTSETNPDNLRRVLGLYSGHSKRAVNTDSF